MQSSQFNFQFYLHNSNGKSFTIKGGTIEVNDFIVYVKQTDNGKEANESVKVGFIFRNGESLRKML